MNHLMRRAAAIAAVGLSGLVLPLLGAASSDRATEEDTVSPTSAETVDEPVSRVP